MRFTEPGQSESVLAAHLEYLCALQGSQRPAYVPVVASGYVLLCSILQNRSLTTKQGLMR